jgi:hypothetical protein
MAVSFIDKDGHRQQVELNGMALYREAMAKKLTIRQLINQKYETVDGAPETFKQFCVSAGLRFKADEQTGVPAANLLEVFDPQMGASTFTSQPAVPDSRILFPAAIMEVIEDSLQSNVDPAVGSFESLVGYRQTIATNKLEQPVISYKGAKGPEDVQFQHVGQNTRPPIVLSLTASDTSRRIPTQSIGMEISREALASNSLDIVALTMSRFLRTADYNEWVSQLGYVLSGDPDAAVSSMSAGTSALSSVTAKSFDTANISAAGSITQLAWLKYLYSNSMTMTKTHAVLDFDAAYAIDTRTNRPPRATGEVDRMDVPFSILYPNFQSDIKFVVMPTGTFTANTVMGLDQRYALGKVTSSMAEYEAIEEVVMKKSTELRIDRGFIVFRIFDTAFNTMTLTV